MASPAQPSHANSTQPDSYELSRKAGMSLMFPNIFSISSDTFSRTLRSIVPLLSRTGHSEQYLDIREIFP